MNKDHPNSSAVGLVGVGLLGSALAQRLVAAGYPPLGFDLSCSAMEALRSLGGRPATSLFEVLRLPQAICLSLPTSAVVREVITQHLEEMQPGSIVIDTTTGDADEVIEIADLLAARHIGYVEANVAGSSQQASRDEASLLISGDAAVVASVEPLLAAICTRRYYLGPTGSASRFKLVHNLVLGLHRAVLAEGLTFAESLGFDPDLTVEILAHTPAYSGVMDTKGAKMAARNYHPQARLSQHRKDVRLILSLAAGAGAAVPLTELHDTLLAGAESQGWGDMDNSAIAEWYRNRRDASHE